MIHDSLHSDAPPQVGDAELHAGARGVENRADGHAAMRVRRDHHDCVTDPTYLGPDLPPGLDLATIVM